MHTPGKSGTSVYLIRGRHRKMKRTYLDVARPPIKIEVKVFYLPKFCELVSDIFLCCFFMNVGYKHDPSFNSYSKMNINEALNGRILYAHRAALVSESFTCDDSTLSYVGSAVTVASLLPGYSEKQLSPGLSIIGHETCPCSENLCPFV